MTPVHFYHMHVGHGHVASRWKPVAEEHFARLVTAGFDGDVHVGRVGDPDKRIEAEEWLDDAREGWIEASEADEGYEQVTLRAVHAFAQHYTTDPATPVLYCHTKGAYQDTPFNRAWRRGMEDCLIGGDGASLWKAAVMALHTHDLVGCHWLTHEEFPETVSEGKPMFGGNMWWATAGYLASLPPVEGGDPARGYNRYKAEEWAGQNNPNVLDLKPGWPDYPLSDGGYDSILGGRLRG